MAGVMACPLSHFGCLAVLALPSFDCLRLLAEEARLGQEGAIMDKLSVMRAFCRIVERGSFTRAADDLGVSAALLSREIGRLEAGLGVGLMLRSTRRLTLTEAGRAYYDEAQSILLAVGNVEERIRARAGLVRGHLKINAPTSFGQKVVAAMLPDFCARHPDLRVSLSLDDRVIDMVEGGFDLTLRIRSSLKDSAMRAKRIGTVRVGIFASSAYLAQHGTPTRPADLGGHRICGYLLSEHLSTWELIGPEQPISVTVDPVVRVGNSLVLRDMLVAGGGLGTLPDFIARGSEGDDRLVRVLPEYELPPRTVWAISPHGVAADARVAAFLTALTQSMGRHS